MIVIGIALAAHEGAGLTGLEHERARAHHVLLVPAWVGIELRLRVHEVEWIGDRRDERSGGILELEHHRLVVGQGHALDHAELLLARARDALRREDDALEAGMHVVGGERRAVMELDALADLEREGLAVVGRLRHLRAQVADELVLGGIIRIGPDQRAVERRNRVDQRKRRLLVAVEARRLVGNDELEYSALLGRLGLGR